MIDLFFILKRLLKEDHEFRAMMYVLAALLVTGTIFYRLVERWSIIDSIYFCIMTISTIGYGDFAPTTNLSKIFTIFLALGGIGIFIAIATKVAKDLTSKRVERNLKSEAKKKRVNNKKIKSEPGHNKK